MSAYGPAFEPWGRYWEVSDLRDHLCNCFGPFYPTEADLLMQMVPVYVVVLLLAFLIRQRPRLGLPRAFHFGDDLYHAPDELAA